jgi:hypothetical protein
VKQSITRRYHIAVGVLLGLVLLETVVMLAIIGRSKNLHSLANDIQTTLIVSVLLIFICGVVIYNLIPVILKRSLSRTGKIINEIAHGNYEVDIEGEIAAYSGDRDMAGLLEGLKAMLRSIHGFDLAKENKIYEHDQRIKQLINLLPQGALIALNNGDISYCNDALRRRYPPLNESKNIRELKLKSEFDQRIFQKIYDSLRFGDNIYDNKIPDTDYLQQVLLNGSIVRNSKGESIGGVYTLAFTEHAKQD